MIVAAAIAKSECFGPKALLLAYISVSVTANRWPIVQLSVRNTICFGAEICFLLRVPLGPEKTLQSDHLGVALSFSALHKTRYLCEEMIVD